MTASIVVRPAPRVGVKRRFWSIVPLPGDSMADSASVASAAGAADRVAAAHQSLLRDPGLQFDFAAEPPPPEVPEWLAAFIRFLGSLRPVFEVLFWVAIAALALVILYFVVREVVRHYQRKVPQASGAQ